MAASLLQRGGRSGADLDLARCLGGFLRALDVEDNVMFVIMPSWC